MDARARAVPVRLNRKRRRKPAQVIAAGTSPQRPVLRARIALAAGEGKENAQIARELGCSETTVRCWQGRFAVPGVPGLSGKPRPGQEEARSRRLTVPLRGDAVVAGDDRRSLLTRKLLRRGDFTSPEDLEAKITAFTIRYNKKARPGNGPTTPTPTTPAVSSAAHSPHQPPTPCPKPREDERTLTTSPSGISERVH